MWPLILCCGEAVQFVFRSFFRMNCFIYSCRYVVLIEGHEFIILCHFSFLSYTPFSVLNFIFLLQFAFNTFVFGIDVGYSR